ncbi:MAG: alanine racemase [Sphingomonadales bacterium 63-6]|nr:MAG: alanine racemase [Sphingomonadales bacterium 63-6]
MKLPDLPPEPPRALRLRLDRDALAENWRVLDRLSGGARAGAAVKADAYGLGTAEAVPVLQAAGARDFFVAHWCEAAAVLAHVPAGQVSVLHGPLTAQDAAYAKATGVKPVINSLRQARLWIDAGGGPCDLMVDTGMNRLGLPMDQLGDPLIGALEIDVLLSHLASADEDSALNEVQLARFTSVCTQVPSRRRSLANSAGISLGGRYAFDLTRPGLALYGGIPCPALNGQIRQVGYPQAAILQTRTIQPGDTVGYNAIFTAEREMRVGVASLGYADGFLRCWGNEGFLLHKGVRLPLLGKISMDMVVVDLEAAPDVHEGDWADVPYDLPQAAAITGLSQYELLTVIGRRFARI